MAVTPQQEGQEALLGQRQNFRRDFKKKHTKTIPEEIKTSGDDSAEEVSNQLPTTLVEIRQEAFSFHGGRLSTS